MYYLLCSGSNESDGLEFPQSNDTSHALDQRRSEEYESRYR